MLKRIGAVQFMQRLSEDANGMIKVKQLLDRLDYNNSSNSRAESRGEYYYTESSNTVANDLLQQQLEAKRNVIGTLGNY